MRRRGRCFARSTAIHSRWLSTMRCTSSSSIHDGTVRIGGSPQGTVRVQRRTRRERRTSISSSTDETLKSAPVGYHGAGAKSSLVLVGLSVPLAYFQIVVARPEGQQLLASSGPYQSSDATRTAFNGLTERVTASSCAS